MYKNIFIIIILIIIFIIINNYLLNNQHKNIDLNIGNYLVLYFYLMGKSFLKEEDFYYSLKNVDFIRDLPSYIPLDYNIRNELIKNNFTIEELVKEENEIIMVAMWTIINKRREKFWLIMKPLINQILNDTFEKNNLEKDVECPVIHFRCSDTPFVRNGYYFFQKYKFFKDSLDSIKREKGINYKKVKLLSCNFHKSTDKNSKTCNVYANSLKDFLENNGYEVIIQCNSNIDDFATIFYAPAIISTCSSFSFIAGFFSNGLFISEGHYDCNINKKKCGDCGKWLKNGYSISHNDIKDYYNTDEVIRLLKS